jgi:hypothetical protein
MKDVQLFKIDMNKTKMIKDIDFIKEEYEKTKFVEVTRLNNKINVDLEKIKINFENKVKDVYNTLAYKNPDINVITKTSV